MVALLTELDIVFNVMQYVSPTCGTVPERSGGAIPQVGRVAGCLRFNSLNFKVKSHHR